MVLTTFTMLLIFKLVVLIGGGVPKQSAEDTKNNINISKEDLGNGQTRWTVVFFPNKGLQNVGSKLSGLCNATFGIAITSDYQIVGKVNMEVISDSTQSFVAHTFKPGSSSATDITIQNPTPEVKFSFDPTTDVEPNGLIRSLAYNNQYLQGPYYFTTATDTGKENLWQTYFKDGTEYNNAYDGNPYLGSNHDFHFNTFKIANETGVDGAKYGDSIIYDTQGGVNGVFSSDNFNQAMEFKSQGTTGNGKTQFSSYVISFITQHTDSHEVGLIKSPTGQQFSGISANIYSYQNLGYYNMMSSLYGEQKVLNVSAKDIIPNWDEAKAANQAIDTALVNKKGEINTATNIDQATKDNLIKEATDAADVAKNAIAEATTVDAIKKAQEDGVTNIYNVKVPSLEDAKQAANQLVDEAVSKKLDEIKANTNLTDEEKTKLTNDANSAANDAKDKIKSATTNDVATQAGKDGVAAIEAVTVPADSGVKKNANQAIDDALNNKKSEINGATNIDQPTKDNLIKEATDAATKAKDAIDKATTNNDVATEQTKGTNAIDAVKVPSLTDSQTAAKQAIDETSGLTDDQKQTAKDQIDKAVDDAKENIKNASDNKGVADATDAGKLAIDKVSAKAAIDAAVAAKKSEIAQAPLTAEEAKPLNNLVDQDADAAKAAIAAATTSAAVETAKNNGVETINNIKVPTTSATKDDANKATDAGNITPTVPGGKVTVKDPSHLTDSEKDQVKKNVEDANKDNFPDGTEITVGDDGTATVTYPDGSKDVIAGTDLIIAAKGEDVLGSKYHSHKNGSNSSQADRVKGASTANGSIANAGNNLGVKAESDNAFVGVKGESDNAIGNNKATSLKTLPQTGTKDTSILGVLGMLLASLGLFGFKKKRDEK
ncbi:LEA family epithelial adhesin [Lactobacillus crispatus]|uniref:LEA family epithelial adhesin n=1 Tax=Lactobacillus crispatus TaxID=47770 RepID=A0AAW8WMH0_9LACO|nr:LEA family epithelial adhesin [Lactobacillus crispatus]MDT9609450.1 LEA family epithelial adhesin [Lactobacillus crispatus]